MIFICNCNKNIYGGSTRPRDKELFDISLLGKYGGPTQAHQQVHRIATTTAEWELLTIIKIIIV